MWYLILFEIIPWSGLIAVADLAHYDNYRKCAAAQKELVVEIKKMETKQPPPIPICVNIEKMNEKDW